MKTFDRVTLVGRALGTKALTRNERTLVLRVLATLTDAQLDKLLAGQPMLNTAIAHLLQAGVRSALGVVATEECATAAYAILACDG